MHKQLLLSWNVIVNIQPFWCFFIHVLTRHTEADKLGDVINAGSVILAGVGVTFFDVLEAPVASVARGTVAAERPQGVHARAPVLTDRRWNMHSSGEEFWVLLFSVWQPG